MSHFYLIPALLSPLLTSDAFLTAPSPLRLNVRDSGYFHVDGKTNSPAIPVVLVGPLLTLVQILQ